MWEISELDITIPASADKAFVAVFCDGTGDAEICFDNIQYSIDSIPYASWPCGSFEESNPYDGSMLVWVQNGSPDAFIERTTDYKTNGDYALKLSDCGSMTELANTDFVGEFTPSLILERPDSMNYLVDLVSYFDENGVHWSYYHYRDCNVWPDKIFLIIPAR